MTYPSDGMMIVAVTPLDPSADEARRLLIRELSAPEYAAAQPTLLDRIAGAIRDWFESLTFGGLSGPPALGVVVVLGIVVVALVLAFFLFGMPRLQQRSRVSGELFGVNDARSSDELRAAAEELASRSDYAGATAEMYRAIARGLSERAVLTTTPGTTAHDFAARAAAGFPDFRDQLAQAATTFDEVRYLGRAGSAEAFTATADLERSLRATQPRLDTVDR
jgi:hypothetical protein